MTALEFDIDLDMASVTATAGRVLQKDLESGREIWENVGLTFVVKKLANDAEKAKRVTLSGRAKLARVVKNASNGRGRARESVEPNVQFDEYKGAKVKERADDINWSS